MSAASNNEGRKANLAYAMIPILFNHLKEKGIIHFDFGGIDPANSEAKGVDHFKKGFGGEIIEHLGEWDSARISFLRFIMNIYLMKKLN